MSNLGKKHHQTRFAIGDRVNIDGCKDTTATVVAINITVGDQSYKLAWMDGAQRSDWFDEFRLSSASGKG